MSRVLLVITGLRLGGAETQLCRVAEGLRERGHEVGIAYLTGSAEVIPDDARVSVESIGMDKSLRGTLRGTRRLRELIREFSPDVVHSHMIHANILARVAAMTTPGPTLINTVHNVFETRNPLLRLFVKATRRVPAMTTFVSDEAMLAYVESGMIDRGAARTVYNGIDTQRFRRNPEARQQVERELSLPDGSMIVLAAGRLEPAKDFPSLLKAFEKVSRSRPEMHLVIAGEGSQRPALEQLRDSLSSGTRIHLLGARSDIPLLMSAADVFALSSAWEGFGLVVGEAMASELFVVATDSGGVREVLGSCGILVPPRDVAALADGIACAAALTVRERSDMAAAGRQRIVANYSLERALDEWVALYQSASQKAS